MLRRLGRSAVFAFAMAVMLVFIGSSLAQSVSVTDYQPPESSSDRLIIDLSGNHATRGSDTVTSKGNAGIVYKRFYDSLSYGYNIDVLGSGLANKSILLDEYVTDYQADATVQFKKYFSSLPALFGSLGVGTTVLKAYDQPAETATLAIGYGRFIDATPLAKAVRIQRFLRNEGVLTGRMSKESMLELADVIARRAEFEGAYGSEYKREWYKELEDVMRRSGKFAHQGLGAAGILRVDEVLNRERIASRFYGWDASIGTKFDIVMPYTDQTRPALNADISANYARPISWQLQLNERLSVNTPVDNFGQAYTATVASDLTYEVSNRIDFRLRHLLKIGKVSDDDALDLKDVLTLNLDNAQFSNSLGVSFIYYLENYINVVASAQLEKNPGQKTATNTLLTLNYRVF